jgi:hypothetical protein
MDFDHDKMRWARECAEFGLTRINFLSEFKWERSRKDPSRNIQKLKRLICVVYKPLENTGFGWQYGAAVFRPEPSDSRGITLKNRRDQLKATACKRFLRRPQDVLIAQCYPSEPDLPEEIRDCLFYFGCCKP